MPTGTPLTAFCRLCRKNYNPTAEDHGVFAPGRETRRTGRIEVRITKSKHKGFGNGGSPFTGHRGEMECLECGHKWWSTHPSSGAVKRSRCRKECCGG